MLRNMIFFLLLSFCAENLSAQNDPDEAIRDAAFRCLMKSRWHYTYASPQTGFENDWIDTKTGKIVSSKEAGGALINGVKRDISDPNRAFNPSTGQNFVWDEKKQACIDAKTGECICPKCPEIKEEVKEKIDSAKRTSQIDQTNNFFAGFSFINEDSYKNFFIFGVNVAYTHPFNNNIGITGDAGIYFGSQNQTDFTKFQILGGVSFFPGDPGGPVLFSPHILAGMVNISSEFNNTKSSSTSFSAAVGTDIKFRLNNSTGIGVRADYNPSFPSGGMTHNFRLSTGLVLRLGEK